MRLLDHEGNRYQVRITNRADQDTAYLCALYNGRGRAEQVIDELKRCGLGKLPASSFDANEAWICASLLAANLMRWTQLLLLDGRWREARIDTLRSFLLHLNPDWPATGALQRAFKRLRQMRTPHLKPA